MMIQTATLKSYKVIIAMWIAMILAMMKAMIMLTIMMTMIDMIKGKIKTVMIKRMMTTVRIKMVTKR